MNSFVVPPLGGKTLIVKERDFLEVARRTKMRLALSLFALILAFCSSQAFSAESEKDESIRPERGGAELWARNCRRCHNLRAPTSYNADQWEVVVNHMRVRANLTAKDAKKIEEFLKAAN